jgi:hypothetical protein
MVQHRDGRQTQRTRRKARLLHQVMREVGDAPRVLPFQEDQQVIQQWEQRQVWPVSVHGHHHAGAVLVARHEDAQTIDFHISCR